MLFVALGKPKPGASQERITRRTHWQYPEGLRLVAEYWPLGSEYAVISIFEGDSAVAMIASLTAWSDVMDITITPAVTAEEGMRLAQGMMAKAG